MFVIFNSFKNGVFSFNDGTHSFVLVADLIVLLLIDVIDVVVVVVFVVVVVDVAVVAVVVWP